MAFELEVAARQHQSFHPRGVPERLLEIDTAGCQCVCYAAPFWASVRSGQTEDFWSAEFGTQLHRNRSHGFPGSQKRWQPFSAKKTRTEPVRFNHSDHSKLHICAASSFLARLCEDEGPRKKKKKTFKWTMVTHGKSMWIIVNPCFTYFYMACGESISRRSTVINFVQGTMSPRESFNMAFRHLMSVCVRPMALRKFKHCSICEPMVLMSPELTGAGRSTENAQCQSGGKGLKSAGLGTCGPEAKHQATIIGVSWVFITWGTVFRLVLWNPLGLSQNDPKWIDINIESSKLEYPNDPKWSKMHHKAKSHTLVILWSVLETPPDSLSERRIKSLKLMSKSS